jgi:uncharacterized protein
MNFEKLKEEVKTYFNEKDGSHNFDHTERVYNLSIKIAKKEKADLEIVKVASLLHDIARGKQERKECKCHAEEGSLMARAILEKYKFPLEKIEEVCYAIKVHRKSTGIHAETKEAQIVQDADRLDALGAITIARVIASGFTEEYKRPVYAKEGDSAIYYLQYKLLKLTPDAFNTETGKKLAKKRYNFMKKYVKAFIDEWNGKY